MSVTAPVTRAGDSNLWLIVVLTALALALLWFVVQKVHYLTDYSPVYYTDYFWPRRAGLIPHLIGGSLAITAGLVQIWLGLTNRVGALHHALGRVYAAGVLIGSLGGFYLALTIPGSTTICCGTLYTVSGMGNHHRHGSVRHSYATHRAAPRLDDPELHGELSHS